MRTISAQEITDTVARLCIEANTRLPQDVQAALDKARQEEPWPLAKSTLDLLWSNLSAAKEENLPICQDTGMACVFVELGTDVHIDGSFEAAIHEGVRRGYTDGYLRKSIVADPLRRGNTGDNTPAAITVHLVDGEGCRITVAPKGFGSENMSQIKMLKPADGVEGFKKFVLDTVKLAGSNPCPPIVLGIGVGGSFDKVAYLAKKALLRPLDVPNPDPYYAQLEQELLAAINELGIGPQGFGGRTPVWALPLSRCYPCGGPACGGEYFLPCDPPCKRGTVRRGKDGIQTDDSLHGRGPCPAQGGRHRAAFRCGVHRPRSGPQADDRSTGQGRTAAL